MPKGFAVKAKLSKKGAARAKEVRGRALDLKPAMRVIGQKMIRSTQQNFDARGRRDGATGVWPALSDVTIAIRKARGALDPLPLQDTGRLKNSIVDNPLNRAVEWGTNTPYAPDHQQGGIFDAKKTVTRTFDIPEAAVGTYVVAAHVRKTKSGKVVKVKAHTVKAHARKAYSVTKTFDLDARVFLRMHAADRAEADSIVRGYIEDGPKGVLAATSGGAA